MTTRLSEHQFKALKRHFEDICLRLFAEARGETGTLLTLAKMIEAKSEEEVRRLLVGPPPAE